jgi:hypothetical protein
VKNLYEDKAAAFTSSTVKEKHSTDRRKDYDREKEKNSRGKVG